MERSEGHWSSAAKIEGNVDHNGKGGRRVKKRGRRNFETIKSRINAILSPRPGEKGCKKPSEGDVQGPEQERNKADKNQKFCRVPASCLGCPRKLLMKRGLRKSKGGGQKRKADKSEGAQKQGAREGCQVLSAAEVMSALSGGKNVTGKNGKGGSR